MKIIRNARVKKVCKYESCMVYKLLIVNLWKQQAVSSFFVGRCIEQSTCAAAAAAAAVAAAAAAAAAAVCGGGGVRARKA